MPLDLIREGLSNLAVHQRVTLMSAAALIGREISDKKTRLRVVALVDHRIREALEAISTSDPFGPRRRLTTRTASRRQIRR